MMRSCWEHLHSASVTGQMVCSRLCHTGGPSTNRASISGCQPASRFHFLGLLCAALCRCGDAMELSLADGSCDLAFRCVWMCRVMALTVCRAEGSVQCAVAGQWCAQ